MTDDAKRQKGKDMHDRTPIFRSLNMIEERIREKLTVEALAQGVHFSKYHYQRMFREAVGDSVMGYVTRRKLALAAGELAETDSTVLEIALRYGYDSHEGFTRSFKSCMGVTPAEYRKYRLPARPRRMEKERSAMMYSKTTDEIIRELNGLIVEARETADYTRKNMGAGAEALFYEEFWDFTAGRAQELADGLSKTLEQVTALGQRPDGIWARFRIVKAMEDAAFAAGVTAFQTGLMIARAREEQRQIYQHICLKYSRLAEHARLKAGKVADFLQELAGLVLQDMRRNGAQRIQAAAEAGRTAAGKLSDSGLPYGYIADGIMEIAERLSGMPLEEVTVTALEDFRFRLDTIAFAAQMDVLRQPSHKPLFDGIQEFQNRLDDCVEFLQGLSWEVEWKSEWKPEGEPEGTQGGALERNLVKMYGDLAMQEGLLLFWLKGEIQKLGTLLEEPRRAALEGVCHSMAKAVELCGDATGETGTGEILRLLQAAYEELAAQAGELGEYGGALAYIAEEVKGPLKHLAD